MSSDPRPALAAFVAALETHLELSAVRRGEDDPAVVTAYQKVADAFVAYDDALLDAYGEVTPLDIPDDDEDEDDDFVDDEELLEGEEVGAADDGYDLDDDDDDAEDDGTYVGLDVEEYDVEDDRRPGGA